MIETELPSYIFSDDELKYLALYFRKNADSIPKVLERLSEFAESYVYRKMTIGEAEAFFERTGL
ncbi:hypothetical protein [Treponema putidum]|uniref:Uncharacterized protein n=1 Tax=Treponema putidum TaxID=221027 RepID=A0AAE9MTJ7_9SPIR|nr:hypothetical protein [Treponema putidum]AIN94566.1 hypothetical protein JO40_11090 [Treponema putidum]TWI78834.1 hypothetical protein JM98_00413 [Treponema putidum]UTY28576.1 hypothetical protein E4N76_05920 [Treponema putidum]UTY31022.1 hypothetical protein E4N75_05400 [Treponema putidum]UTY33442.1 hypothetical protein E4N74_05010 [Treponema putidum]